MADLSERTSAAGAVRTIARIARSRTLELVLAVLVIYLAATTPNFFTVSNMFNVLRSVSQIGVIAFGMTMVIIAGEIDLSVGSAVSFASCLIAVLAREGVPIPLACTLTLTCGFALGCFSGVMRTRYQVPTFITTLALMSALAGAALKISNSFSVPLPDSFGFLGGGYILKTEGFPGIPFPVIIFLCVFAAVQFLMSSTTFGRSVYAVGGNAETARLCGINVSSVRILVLGITGVLAALSGIMAASRSLSGDPKSGIGLELDVIAAVIVGGTSITGGAGRVWGTLIGVVFIGVVGNGLTMKGVQADEQLIVRGAIILVAVLLSRITGRKG
jgi:ribose/xylose/arabinose/galactoside ABC-type transport system permease subunit